MKLAIMLCEAAAHAVVSFDSMLFSSIATLCSQKALFLIVLFVVRTQNLYCQP